MKDDVRMDHWMHAHSQHGDLSMYGEQLLCEDAHADKQQLHVQPSQL